LARAALAKAQFVTQWIKALSNQTPTTLCIASNVVGATKLTYKKA